jgi:hypothetical protein
MLRNLKRQFPVGTQPIVKTWRLRRFQFLDDTDVVGSPRYVVKRALGAALSKEYGPIEPLSLPLNAVIFTALCDNASIVRAVPL